MSDEDLKNVKNKKVRAFYEKQNGILDMFKEGLCPSHSLFRLLMMS